MILAAQALSLACVPLDLRQLDPASPDRFGTALRIGRNPLRPATMLREAAGSPTRQGRPTSTGSTPLGTLSHRRRRRGIDAEWSSPATLGSSSANHRRTALRCYERGCPGERWRNAMRTTKWYDLRAGAVQMVERQLSKLKVAGSIPASRSSPDRSLARARGGRPPESHSVKM